MVALGCSEGGIFDPVMSYGQPLDAHADPVEGSVVSSSVNWLRTSSKFLKNNLSNSYSSHPCFRGDISQEVSGSQLRQGRFCCYSVTRRVQLFVTPWTVARQASVCFTNSWSLLKLMSIELVMPSSHFVLCCPSNHLVLCHPLISFSFCLQSFPASESFLIKGSFGEPNQVDPHFHNQQWPRKPTGCLKANNAKESLSQELWGAPSAKGVQAGLWMKCRFHRKECSQCKCFETTS